MGAFAPNVEEFEFRPGLVFSVSMILNFVPKKIELSVFVFLLMFFGLRFHVG